MSTNDQNTTKKWENYYQKTFKGKPRPFLLEALKYIHFQEGYHAIDLGCGSGNDTLHLLKNNWRVTAIDQEEGSINFIQSLTRDAFDTKVELIKLSFEEIKNLPKTELIYSSLSLPFCKKENFNELWNNIIQACKPNTIIAVQFFGENHEWVKTKGLLGQSRFELEKLFFDKFELLNWDEKNELAPTALDGEIWWHFHSIIPKKI